MNKYTEILDKQISIDYDCTLDDVRDENNVYRLIKCSDNSRPIGDENTLLKIAVYREKLFVMADAELMDWCRETFKNYRGTWLSEPQNLVKIDKKLQEFNQQLSDTHHHYIPAENFPAVKHTYDVKWYEQDEIEVFRNDDRFGEALLFDEDTPDMLAVCAMDGNSILGMASATANTPLTWEIGVNVTDEGAGKGIGSYVTALLKEEILKRGILPTYATVESHIKSQKVAFRAGFEPAFYELFSE